MAIHISLEIEVAGSSMCTRKKINKVAQVVDLVTVEEGAGSSAGSVG